MISGKELTLDEIIEEMNNLKKRIYSIATQMEINISNIMVKAITPNDVKVKGGKIGDKMTNFVIKDDELKEELESKIASYNEYRKKAIAKIEATDDVNERIVFYRDKLHWKWYDIAKTENFSIRQAQRRYKIYKKSKDVAPCRDNLW